MCATGCGGCSQSQTLGTVVGTPATNPFSATALPSGSAPTPQPAVYQQPCCPKPSLMENIFLALAVAVVLGFVFGGNK